MKRKSTSGSSSGGGTVAAKAAAKAATAAAVRDVRAAALMASVAVLLYQQQQQQHQRRRRRRQQQQQQQQQQQRQQEQKHQQPQLQPQQPQPQWRPQPQPQPQPQQCSRKRRRRQKAAPGTTWYQVPVCTYQVVSINRRLVVRSPRQLPVIVIVSKENEQHESTTRTSRATPLLPQLYYPHTPNTNAREAPTCSKDVHQDTHGSNGRSSGCVREARGRQNPGGNANEIWGKGAQVGPCVLYHLERDGAPRRGRAGTVNAQAYPTKNKTAKVAAKPMISSYLRVELEAKHHDSRKCSRSLLNTALQDVEAPRISGELERQRRTNSSFDPFHSWQRRLATRRGQPSLGEN